MKNWGQLFSNKANEMTYLMSDARKEMMIVEHIMTYCVNCKYFEEKKEGYYWTTGCLNPRTPLRFKNYNEEIHELFRAFACPFGEPVKKESVENVDTDNKNGRA